MRFARWTFFAAIVGTLAGLSSTAFLYTLDFATKYRQAHPQIIWILPLAGLLIGWIYHRYGRDVNSGTNLILEEIHNPKDVVPVKMAPLIFFGTVLTHLFGGSAGREGTAVQMGASLADQLSRFFKIEKSERKILLVCGMGAGFASAIGAPIAGAIFGMEVLWIGRLRPYAVWESLVASLFGYAVTLFLSAPHSRYPHVAVPSFTWMTLLGVVIVGVLCGLTAFLFVRATHALEHLEKKLIRLPQWRPFLGGLVLALLFQIPGAQVYAGLGIETIQHAMMDPAHWYDPIAKMFFTVLTIGSGFKGGEFIPLVFMGSTMGSVIGTWLQVPFQLLAAVGFAALFGSASMAPIACTIMAAEIFGLSIIPYALVGCVVAYLCSGKKSIYQGQR